MKQTHTINQKTIEYFDEPLTIEEIIELKDETEKISGNVIVDINEIIDNDLETILDILALKLVNNVCLMEINYNPIAIIESDDGYNGTMIINVSGNVSSILEMEGYYDEEDE